MEKFASQDSRSYSLNFYLNIWFRARKVTGTFEKRVPGLQQFFSALWPSGLVEKWRVSGPPGHSLGYAILQLKRRWQKCCSLILYHFKNILHNHEKTATNVTGTKLSFKNFLLFCQAFPVHRAGCDLRDTVILLSCQYLATCPDVLQRTGRKSG